MNTKNEALEELMNIAVIREHIRKERMATAMLKTELNYPNTEWSLVENVALDAIRHLQEVVLGARAHVNGGSLPHR